MTAVPRPARAVRPRRLDERRRPRLAGRRRRRRSASRSPTSRPPAAAGTAGPGSRRRARRCWCSLGFRPDLARARPGLAAGRDRRRSRWPRPPRTSAGPARPAPIRLKWPNDLVVATAPERSRRGRASSAGVLGETERPRDRPTRARSSASAINADWAAADFPADLAATMTSLRELAGGAPDRPGRPARRVPRAARAARRRAPGRALRRRRLDRPPGDDRPARSDSRRPDGHRDAFARPASTRRPARSSSPIPRHRDGRPSRPRRRGHPRPAGQPVAGGCNAMARPAFWKVDRPEEGGPRLAHLDRDRRLVEAAQADPARFDALYRKYLAQVYSYAFYELGDHHDAEDATERTFLAALANLARFEERARPADGEGASTFRVWLFQIARNAVAERRRAVAAAIPRRRSRPPRRRRARSTSRATPRRATRPRPRWRAVGRLPDDRRRALILRFVDEMSHRRDRRRPRPVRGRRPGPHPPRPAEPSRATSATRRGDRRVRRPRRRRGRRPRHRPLSRGAARRPATARRRSTRRPTPASTRAVRAGRRPARPRPVRGPPVVPVRGARSRRRLAEARRRGCASPTAAGGEGRRRPVDAAAPDARRRRRPRPTPTARPTAIRGRSRPAAAHRRRPDLGRPLARRRRATSPGGAAGPAGRPDGPGRRGRPRARPATRRGSSDADQAAVVPRPPRRLPARPVDEVPVVRGDAVQQAAREGAPRLPDLRPPLPAVGARPGSACSSTTGSWEERDAGLAVGRPARASSTRRPIRTGSRRPSARPGMRDAAVWGTGRDRRPAASRSASWTSGSWAARWARSSARRSTRAAEDALARARAADHRLARRAAPGCRRARSP